MTDIKTIETGSLTEWNDVKGFGFIYPEAGERLFVHISAFDSARRPAPGDKVTFERGIGRNGGPVAVKASIKGAPVRVLREPLTTEGAQRARAWRLAAAAVLALLLIQAEALGAAPPWTIIIYVGIGAVSAFAYWYDKRAAAKGGWRLNETMLHGLDLIGGIMGGLLAQAALHHKTAKPSYGAVSAGIAVLHLCGVGLLIYLGLKARGGA